MKIFSQAAGALIIASILSLIQSVSSQHPFDIGRQVNTTSGIIQGHAAPDRKEVSEYLGIPFARPPVDSLRFAPPKSYRSSNHFNASSFGLSCLAPVTKANYSILTEKGFNLASTAEEYYDTIFEHGVAMGEDCLTLNVWTKPQTGEKAKAVLFFIYGGGFQIGFSSNPFTNGQSLADEQDVIVISANYRINVFGFPGIQSEAADSVAPNVGLLDQRLAIEWARDNVAAFGGDPTRITLFGQSAGAASVSMYGYAYASDPIVNGLISQSGTADSFGTPPSNLTAAWQSLASLLGCNGDANSTSSSPDAASLSQSVACVRSLPASAVLAASLQIPPTVSALGAFAPSDDSGRTAFSNYSQLTAAGQFARVPRLIGSNAQEGGSFRLEFTMQGADLPAVFWEWYTLVIFTCPASAAAAGFATTHGVADPKQQQPPPVWRYTYHGDYPNTQLTVNPSIGAYHGAELGLLFGTADTLGIPDTPVEAAISQLMGAAWASFAKNPYNGLAEAPFLWPALPPSTLGPAGATTAQTVLLGLGNATSAVFEPSALGDAPCPVLMPAFEAIGGPAGLLALAGAANDALAGIRDGDVIAVAKALLRLAGVEDAGL